jgi:hypothetical protein
MAAGRWDILDFRFPILDFRFSALCLDLEMLASDHGLNRLRISRGGEWRKNQINSMLENRETTDYTDFADSNLFVCGISEICGSLGNPSCSASFGRGGN